MNRRDFVPDQLASRTGRSIDFSTKVAALSGLATFIAPFMLSATTHVAESIACSPPPSGACNVAGWLPSAQELEYALVLGAASETLAAGLQLSKVAKRADNRIIQHDLEKYLTSVSISQQ